MTMGNYVGKLWAFLRSWDFFSALGFLVSLASMWFAWSANHMARQQNEKTTDPYLIPLVEITPSADPKQHKLGVYFKNVGLGPAFILGFEAYKNSKPVTSVFSTNGHDLAASFGLEKNVTTRDQLSQGQVISVGERLPVFEVTEWRELLTPQQFFDFAEKGIRGHSLVVCYASVYQERRFAYFGRGLNKDNVGCTGITKASPTYSYRQQLSPVE